MKYDWQSVDWSQPSGKIAVALGTQLAAVSRMRRKLAPETLTKCCPNRTINWAQADWSLQNRNVAKQLGCSETAVIMRRQQNGPVNNAACRIFAVTYRGKLPPPLQSFTTEELRKIAETCSILRDACMKAGAKKPRTIGKYKAPRLRLAGQVKSLLCATAQTPRQLHGHLPAFTLQQIQSALSGGVRDGWAAIQTPRRGTIPAQYTSI